jgi:FKBP-type peptidyl-prolyl cis-trans isomerase SlyD
MKADDRLYISIDYKLTLDSGEAASQSPPGEPLGFIFGRNQIISGLEKRLRGMEPGQTARFIVEPEEGYGLPNPDLYRDIPRVNFPEAMDIKPGMSFEARGPHGPVTFRVRSLADDVVGADFNHPLAGKRLHFDVEVLEVREPRAEELATLTKTESCNPSACSGCAGSCGG